MTNQSAQESEALEKRLVWEYFGFRTTGTFVDVGANDPVFMSQTYLLESKGWTGILVEPIAECAQALREKRPKSIVFQAAAGAPGKAGESLIHIPAAGPGQSFIQVQIDTDWSRIERAEKIQIRTLDDMLREAGVSAIDFLSIDVEGMELDVLRGLDLQKYRPGLILIEDHVRTLQVHFHLRKQGYRLVKRTGLNNWYVPQKTRFTLTTRREKADLFRKIWLKHPFRRLGLAFQHHRRAKWSRA